MQSYKKLSIIVVMIFWLLVLWWFFSVNVTKDEAHAAWTDDFITTWKTDNPGTSSSTAITIAVSWWPYDVDWDNDGVFDEFGLNNTTSHDYGVAGTYTVRIQGALNRINFGWWDSQKIISVDQWGSSVWTDMSSAFAWCSNVTINAIDVPDLSQVTDMSNMFRWAAWFNGDLSQWDVSNVTTMHSMFYQSSSFNSPLNNWDVSNVTNMQYMFWWASSFNQDLNNWNVGNITSMREMFAGATSFNGNISNWDVSHVTNFRFMFYGNINFNQDIWNWDVSSVTDMYEMFTYARSFNQNLTNWNVSNVTNMTYMFYGATVFNGNINNWNVSNVQYMNWMFWATNVFNQDISNWNTVNVISMSEMFNDSIAFNQNIWNWNVGNVLNMSSMFNWAIAFDQNIWNWDVSHVTAMNGMFADATLSETNYDSLLSGWALQLLQNWVNFDWGHSQYCASENARTDIITTHSWTILDGGQHCTPLPQVIVSTWSSSNSSNGYAGGSYNLTWIVIDWSVDTTDININNSGSINTGESVMSWDDQSPVIDESIFNPTITGCVNRSNEPIIDQWNNISEKFKISHQMLYSYYLTKWRGTVDYRPATYITREQAAKFMTQFAENVLCRKKQYTYNNRFADLDKADDTLQDYIKLSYEYWIFKWSNWLFRPKDIITKDELIAVIIRLIKNKYYQEERSNNWAVIYREILPKYTHTESLNSLKRENIANVMYDVYRTNEYEMHVGVWYVVK